MTIVTQFGNRDKKPGNLGNHNHVIDRSAQFSFWKNQDIQKLVNSSPTQQTLFFYSQEILQKKLDTLHKYGIYTQTIYNM